jgi:hypothetical protein
VSVECLFYKATEPSPLQDSFSVRQKGGLPGVPDPESIAAQAASAEALLSGCHGVRRIHTSLLDISAHRQSRHKQLATLPTAKHSGPPIPCTQFATSLNPRYGNFVPNNLSVSLSVDGAPPTEDAVYVPENKTDSLPVPAGSFSFSSSSH